MGFSLTAVVRDIFASFYLNLAPGDTIILTSMVLLKVIKRVELGVGRVPHAQFDIGVLKEVKSPAK